VPPQALRPPQKAQKTQNRSEHFDPPRQGHEKHEKHKNRPRQGEEKRKIGKVENWETKIRIDQGIFNREGYEVTRRGKEKMKLGKVEI